MVDFCRRERTTRQKGTNFADNFCAPCLFCRVCGDRLQSPPFSESTPLFKGMESIWLFRVKRSLPVLTVLPRDRGRSAQRSGVMGLGGRCSAHRNCNSL